MTSDVPTRPSERCSDAEAPAHRGIVSYVRRSPRMNESQRRALERLSGDLIVEVARGELETSVAVQPPLDWTRIFGRRAPLSVEIGSGTGDALTATAGAHPEWNCVGFEVFLPGVASTLTKLEAAGCDNARVVIADGVAGLRELFAASSIQHLSTFFPDPWHKARHHKRRLINTDFARLASERCEPGALWRIATDWDDYAYWIIDAIAAVPAWLPIDAPDGHTSRPSTRPVTRFEQRGLDAGRTIHDFAFRRIVDTSDHTADTSEDIA